MLSFVMGSQDVWTHRRRKERVLADTDWLWCPLLEGIKITFPWSHAKPTYESLPSKTHCKMCAEVLQGHWDQSCNSKLPLVKEPHMPSKCTKNQSVDQLISTQSQVSLPIFSAIWSLFWSTLIFSGEHWYYSKVPVKCCLLALTHMKVQKYWLQYKARLPCSRAVTLSCQPEAWWCSPL